MWIKNIFCCKSAEQTIVEEKETEKITDEEPQPQKSLQKQPSFEQLNAINDGEQKDTQQNLNQDGEYDYSQNAEV